MKKATKTLNEVELQREYPLADLVGGWFFRCEETSAGCYQVEGMDLWGRTVLVIGFDPEHLLVRCVTDAKAISSQKYVTD